MKLYFVNRLELLSYSKDCLNVVVTQFLNQMSNGGVILSRADINKQLLMKARFHEWESCICVHSINMKMTLLKRIQNVMLIRWIKPAYIVVAHSVHVVFQVALPIIGQNDASQFAISRKVEASISGKHEQTSHVPPADLFLESKHTVFLSLIMN